MSLVDNVSEEPTSRPPGGNRLDLEREFRQQQHLWMRGRSMQASWSLVGCQRTARNRRTEGAGPWLRGRPPPLSFSSKQTKPRPFSNLNLPNPVTPNPVSVNNVRGENKYPPRATAANQNQFVSRVARIYNMEKKIAALKGEGFYYFEPKNCKYGYKEILLARWNAARACYELWSPHRGILQTFQGQSRITTKNVLGVYGGLKRINFQLGAEWKERMEVPEKLNNAVAEREAVLELAALEQAGGDAVALMAARAAGGPPQQRTARQVDARSVSARLWEYLREINGNPPMVAYAHSELAVRGLWTKQLRPPDNFIPSLF